VEEIAEVFERQALLLPQQGQLYRSDSKRAGLSRAGDSLGKIEDAYGQTSVKNRNTWTDVKAKLKEFDRASLFGLLQSLYAAHKDNQTFLHARFGLGESVLEPYKKTIDRWLWPDLFRKQDTSVSQAKRAISDYTKAVGDSEGLAELQS
jgi:hypothetical protein